jgi:hypothetical protein
VSAWQGLIRAVGAILGGVAVIMIGHQAYAHASTETRLGLLIPGALIGAALAAIIARQ